MFLPFGKILIDRFRKCGEMGNIYLSQAVNYNCFHNDVEKLEQLLWILTATCGSWPDCCYD